MKPAIGRSRSAVTLLMYLMAATRVLGWTCGNDACVTWSAGEATMYAELGAAPGVLLNGTTSWDENVVLGAEQWNAAGAQFQFAVETPATAPDPCVPPSGLMSGNPMVWSETVCGSAFGANTLAVTTSWHDSANHKLFASVFFNSRQPWNAYSGPRRTGSDGSELNDVQRVATHELGHVLGLFHPDQFGQSVSAIMNSQVSDVYGLTADDVAGIRALYPEKPDQPVPTPTPTPTSNDPASNAAPADAASTPSPTPSLSPPPPLAPARTPALPSLPASASGGGGGCAISPGDTSAGSMSFAAGLWAMLVAARLLILTRRRRFETKRASR